MSLERDVVKDRVSNHVMEAVQEVIAANMSVREFLVMASECWEQELNDQKRMVVGQFAKALVGL